MPGLFGFQLPLRAEISLRHNLIDKLLLEVKGLRDHIHLELNRPVLSFHFPNRGNGLFAGIGYSPIGPPQHLTTDSNGCFRTGPMPVAQLYLSVMVPNRQLAWINRQVSPHGVERLEPLHLERDVPINGLVKDPQGNPVGGVVIIKHAGHPTVSGSDGRFTIHGFGPRPRITITMHKDGYIPVRWEVRDDGIYWHGLLPAGEYGLKVGHDAYQESEVPRGEIPEEAWSKTAEPWKRAKVVTVKPGGEVTGVELELPPP